MHGSEPLGTSSIAKRLRTELGRLVSFDKNKPIYKEWAKAWSLKPADPQQPQLVAMEVARRLYLLDRQLSELQTRLQRDYPRLSPNTTTNQIHRFKLIVAKCLENLGAPWGNVEPELTPDLVKCLEFWDELVESDEVIPPSDELVQLVALIRDLRASAEQISDVELKAAVLAILDQLERAIFDFEAGGPAAFNAAFREAVSEVYAHESTIRQNVDTPQVGKLVTLWARFVDVCGPLIFADNLLTAGARIKEIGKTILALMPPVN